MELNLNTSSSLCISFFSIISMIITKFTVFSLGSSDTLSAAKSLTLAEILVSANRSFEMGFFRPGQSSDYYVGIWYKEKAPQTVVWVANRREPISSSEIDSAQLRITDGNLVIRIGETGKQLSITNLKSSVSAVEATLLDTGNLVLTVGAYSERTRLVWQSFDHPTNTFLPGMKMVPGMNLVSWESPDQPEPGNFTFQRDENNDQYIIRKGSSLVTYWKSGMLDQFKSSNGFPVEFLLSNFSTDVVLINYTSRTVIRYSCKKYKYHSCLTMYSNTRLLMSSSGKIQFLKWDSNQRKWLVGISEPQGPCSVYNYCGNNGICNSNGSVLCECLPGYEPAIAQGWEAGEYSSGCNRKQGLSAMLKLTIIIATVVAVGISCIAAFIFCRRKLGAKNREETISLRQNIGIQEQDLITEDEKKAIEVPFFSLGTILAATNNFSSENKLGQGGFGPVFKGNFPGEQTSAVKRLLSNCGQGVDEFKNEVMLIAKLQHRNLVKLLGYCITTNEKILLYEYMPNKSLDVFIFDQKLKGKLNWKMRFDIILGIARGLLYLHQDSRFRIIHRDLKASNILLDEEMNPKISDFGLARIVEGKSIEANTNRVVGTFGYMSPEYALEGLFSIKSDVFSFGVVVLEIITGRKNTSFYQSKESLNLLGHVWKFWIEETTFDIVDPELLKSSDENNARHEILKCIHMGLLCVQEDPSDRPTMADVVIMLVTESMILPRPNQPAFVARRHVSSMSSSSSSTNPRFLSNNNELSVSVLQGR